MNRNSYRFTWVLLPILLLSPGCGTKSRPKGLPPLYPTTVEIMQEGAPLEGATVVFYPDGAQLDFLVSGITQPNGKATLVTHGEFKGAPAGKYKVCVTKYKHDPVPTRPVTADAVKKWEEEMRKKPPMTYCFVERQYTSQRTTPLEAEIDEKENDITLDIGKAVREGTPVSLM